MENKESHTSIKLHLTMEQYGNLIEYISRANALTQVILANHRSTLDNIPVDALYDFGN